MNRKHLAYCILFPLFGTLSCQPERGTAINGLMNNQPSSSNSPVLSTQTDSIGKTQGAWTFSVKADYPTSGSFNLVRGIREWISESLGGSFDGDISQDSILVNHYAQQCFARYSGEDDESFKEDGITCCEEHAFIRHWENDSLVTYLHTTYWYGGGAHGGFATTGATFRKSDGRRFGWEMIRQTNDEDPLIPLIAEGLKGYFEVTTDEQLMENLMLGEDWRTPSSLPRPDTEPWIDGDGLQMVYQEYEICCYAAGSPTVTVPLDKALPLLTNTMVSCLR